MELIIPITITDVSSEQRSQIRRLASLGLRLPVIANLAGVTTGDLSTACEQEIAAAGLESQTAVLAVLLEMATSQKSVSATIFWIKTFCAHLLPTKRNSRDESRHPPQELKFHVFNNDGAPNDDY